MTVHPGARNRRLPRAPLALLSLFALSPTSRRSLLSVLLALVASAAQADTATAPPVLEYQVLAQYPHDPSIFTQGLEIADDALYESSGLYGQSFVIRHALPGAPPTSAAPVERRALPERFFGEGLTVWKDSVYIATWREHRGLILNRKTLQPTGNFPIAGEGWGLTHDDRHLILSDGSATLQFIDPRTFAVEKTVTVRSAGQPIDRLNELEWIPADRGQPARILANIWQTDELVAIDPADGRVTARLDLRDLYPHGLRSPRADVMNGIAFDAEGRTLLVTGKFWPRLYRIRLGQPLP